MYRFHVLCSHLLCEQDTSTFDQKMNAENLNKCLLSLKEFYRDLRVEQVRRMGSLYKYCSDICMHAYMHVHVTVA